MISTQFGFLYLHVPKTAGNAIQRALLPFSDDRMVLRAGQDGIDRFGIAGPVTPKKHALLRDYEARAPGITARLSVLISVRHPFTRAVSAFSHTRSVQGIRSAPDEAAFWQMLKASRYQPMVNFLRLDEKLHTPAHVLRHETLIQDFEKAKEALALPDTLRLARLNPSRAPVAETRRLLSSRRLRDAVEAHFQDDMDYFSYDSYQLQT